MRGWGLGLGSRSVNVGSDIEQLTIIRCCSTIDLGLSVLSVAWHDGTAAGLVAGCCLELDIWQQATLTQLLHGAWQELHIEFAEAGRLKMLHMLVQ